MPIPDHATTNATEPSWEFVPLPRTAGASPGEVFALYRLGAGALLARAGSECLLSRDGGATWAVLGDDTVACWASTVVRHADGWYAAGRHALLYRGDGDSEWTSLGRSFLETEWPLQVHWFRVDPNGGLWVGGTADRYRLRPNPTEVWRSVDRGATWAAIDPGPLEGHVEPHLAFDSAGRTLVVAPGGLARWDGGWSQINSLPGSEVTALSGSRVFVGGGPRPARVSFDDGATFAPVASRVTWPAVGRFVAGEAELSGVTGYVGVDGAVYARFTSRSVPGSVVRFHASPARWDVLPDGWTLQAWQAGLGLPDTPDVEPRATCLAWDDGWLVAGVDGGVFRARVGDPAGKSVPLDPLLEPAPLLAEPPMRAPEDLHDSMLPTHGPGPPPSQPATPVPAPAPPSGCLGWLLGLGGGR